MGIQLAITFVSVDDQDRALTFYRDALGLEVRTDVMFEQFRWLAVGPPDQPDVELVLQQVGMGHPADVDTLAGLLAKGSLSSVIFSVDSADATFEKLQSAGFEVLQEPIDQPYGVRDLAFRDPAGNMVRFSERLKR